MENPFSRRPWLWVVVAFIVLIGAWTALIFIAQKNKPEVIELPQKAEQDGQP